MHGMHLQVVLELFGVIPPLLIFFKCEFPVEFTFKHPLELSVDLADIFPPPDRMLAEERIEVRVCRAEKESLEVVGHEQVKLSISGGLNRELSIAVEDQLQLSEVSTLYLDDREVLCEA